MNIDDKTFDLLKNIAPLILQYGLQIVGAFVILIIGFSLGTFLGRRVKKLFFRMSHVDDTFAPVMGNITKILIYVITLLAVLNQFGVQTTSIIAVLGAAGLAVGLALQGTLSNVASGVMLLIFRPFKIGDTVKVNGNVCVVKEIGLFLSRFHSLDNVNIYLPNSNIWGSEIQNFSENEKRRNDIIVGISYTDDINKAIEVAKDELNQDTRVLKEDDILVVVESLGDSSVNLLIRYWTLNEHFWHTKFDFNKRIKERFDKESISIPFPQRDVHIYNEKAK